MAAAASEAAEEEKIKEIGEEVKFKIKTKLIGAQSIVPSLTVKLTKCVTVTTDMQILHGTVWRLPPVHGPIV